MAESVPEGPLCQEVAALASRYAITIGVGLVEVADDDILYNAYYVVNADGTWVNHRKLHCFITRERLIEIYESELRRAFDGLDDDFDLCGREDIDFTAIDPPMHTHSVRGKSVHPVARCLTS